MQEFDFPLFQDPKEHLACFDGKVKFSLDGLLGFCERVHYSGASFLEQDVYDATIPSVGSLRQDLEFNFVARDGKVYFRGENYYLGGAKLHSPQKIEMMFRNLRSLNSLIEKISSADEPSNIGEAAIFASVFDHLKHYFMVSFNAIYKKCVVQGDDDALNTAFGLCSSAIDAYYGSILNGKLVFEPISEGEIKKLEKSVDSNFLPDELDFYREMDNPQRILLHAGNVINHADKKYCVVVNPLSGATEPGFALKSISEETGRPVVSEVFPLRYSIYQDEEGEVHDFESLMEWAVPGCFIGMLPLNRKSPILILDDNIATGETLARLKILFEEKYKDVDTSAIESRRKYYPTLDEYATKTDKQVLAGLAFNPIGETRRNQAVYNFVNQILIGGG